MPITLNSPLSKALSTTKGHLDALAVMGIKTVEDLLLYFPRTYEVHNQSGSLSDIRTDLVNTIEAKLIDKASSLSKRTRRWIYKAILEDRSGSVFEAVWFNKPYQLDGIREGEFRTYIGKIKFEFGKVEMVSPKIEKLIDNLHSRSLVPVYSATEKISSSWLMQKIEPLLYLCKEFRENLPEELVKEEKLIDRTTAIKQVHFPEDKDVLDKARERLAFEELFRIQMDALVRKKEYQESSTKYNISMPMDANRSCSV